MWFMENWLAIAKIIAGIAFPPYGLYMLVDLFLDSELGQKVTTWFMENWLAIAKIVAGIAFPPLGIAMLVDLLLDGAISDKVSVWWRSVRRAIGDAVRSLPAIVIDLPYSFADINIDPAGAIADFIAPEPLTNRDPGFQHGGITTGLSPIPAVLHPDEAVIPLDRLPSIVGQINQRQAGGGEVHIHLEGATILGVDDLDERIRQSIYEARRIATSI